MFEDVMQIFVISIEVMIKTNENYTTPFILKFSNNLKKKMTCA